jgi:hypothetical protein
MDSWTLALTTERQNIAKKLYEKLNAIPWKDLSKTDRVTLRLLGYFSLEEDQHPSELIDTEL